MDLCVFWKARVRKELLSERDGNCPCSCLGVATITHLSGRNFSLKEMETFKIFWLWLCIDFLSGRNFSLKEMETKTFSM